MHMKPGSMGSQQLDKRKDSRPMVLYGPQIDLSTKVLVGSPEEKNEARNWAVPHLLYQKKMF